MDVELTPERESRLAEAGYVPAPGLGTVPVRGRIRVHDADGHLCDLQLIALPDGARELAIAHLTGWFAVADPAVEPLVDALDLDDAIGYLTGVAPACTLETFVQVTGRLGAGHTSTLLVTIGRALARLHARGLRYGPIRPQDVLIADGQVLLTVPKPALDGAALLAPSPQEDTYHLAALADAVIAPAHGPQAGERPEPGLRGLIKLIISALGDAESRPGVGTLATLSHDLAPCLPLVLPRSAAPEASPVPGASEVAEGSRGRRVTRSQASGSSGVTRRGSRDSLDSQETRGSRGSQRQGSLDRPRPRRRAFLGNSHRAGVPRLGDIGADDPRPSRPRTAERRRGSPRPERSPAAGRVIPTSHGRVRGPAVFVGGVLAAVLVGGGFLVHRWGADAPAHAASSQEVRAAAEEPHGATQDDPAAAAARLTSARMDTVVALTNAPDLPPEDQAGGEAARDDWQAVVVPGSPAHLQATELVTSLRADGATISGLAVETGDVVVLDQQPASAAAPAAAQVQVTFTVSAYTVESAGGALTVPAGPPRTAVLDLVATDTGWLVAEVRESEPPA